ncbi:uncharacterized protein BX664DRAFT_331098 [Halteromyces radiatus]|uniref:uncharacterized protein n=1 Tax=Halteromyces radiatus TaxID=101107 RepID=UPI0022202CAD|nr:uncharacterized protein BX664DRAFT_331098 [Halteromyces radiatus]KAI8088677.1 hypothetical protein BX664DRAFT_331098 [Halteromyces radiatus]
MTIDNQCVVDIHTHVYVPSYLQLLRERTQVPRILPPLDPEDESSLERLVILPGEDKDASTANGRPVTLGFSHIGEKLKFMDQHGIDISVISLANPWLDFLPDTQATYDMARNINNEIQFMCDQSPTRLYSFGVLPLNSVKASIDEVQRISTSLKSMRGVIMGTHGCGGKGLDFPELIPLFQTIADNDQFIFLHPHYGIPINKEDDSLQTSGNNKGHALQLALGFPMETTIAVTRLILSGIFDKIPHLKLLLAHSGGTLPFLAGRIDSCVAHDPVIAQSLQHPPSWYLKKLYYDAVIYHDTGIRATVDFADPQHVMFGTDHPFFPPLDTQDTNMKKDKRWLSVDSNLDALDQAGLDKETKNGILGANAIRLLNLQ